MPSSMRPRATVQNPKRISRVGRAADCPPDSELQWISLISRVNSHRCFSLARPAALRSEKARCTRMYLGVTIAQQSPTQTLNAR